MTNLTEQAIESQAKQIKVAMSMVGLCVMNGDYKEAVKFASSLSTMAFGTGYQEIVATYLESVSFIYEQKGA